jgi:hypothetical protein
MSRITVSSTALVFALGLAMGSYAPALAQSTPSKASQTAQSKMRNAEEPSSPEKQAAAAKQAACSKQAKAQKLHLSKRRAFIKDCMNKS